MGVAERNSELDTEQQAEETTEEQVEQTETEEQTEEGESGAEGNDGEDEDVVQIGEEEPPASEEEKTAPKWVKDLRERQRQLTLENRELKARLGTGQPAAQGKPELPAKPKLADFDYDEEQYEQARDAWDAKKRDVDSWEANQRAAANAQQEHVRKLNEAYSASKASLKVKDFDDAEETVSAALNEWQQGVLKVGPANPGVMVYALGHNPKKLAELASIKDPVKFAVAVGKLETEVKVTKRTSTKPAPETTVRGNSSAPTSTATLERLQAEADKTGDRTKVAAYLRQQRSSGK